MASYAGEGTSREGDGDGGGVGGKFRKRSFRKPKSTPYDRPPTALRSPNRDGGWFSKIITPASRLVTSSAQLFFSSLLRKRIAPPPQQSPPEIGRESTESVQEAVQIIPRVHQSSVDDQKCSPDSFDGSGISELEHTLKQRTFTRSEINHLMDLLHSRTNEFPNKDNDNRAGTSLGLPILPAVVHDKVAGSPVTARRASYLESQKCSGWISSPAMNSQVPEDNISSPAELAKAYMGNRTSEVSPSMLSMRGQVHKEDAMLRNIVPFSPKTSAMSLVRTTGRAAIPENGFITPRSLGRSAIYNMARTPYSKVHPASSQKTLKRRSAMEDDEYGSVGPIRRLRQKTNLSTTNSLNRFVAQTPRAGGVLGVDSDVVQDPSSSKNASLSLDESDSRIPLTVRKSGKGIRGTSYTSIPSKSTAVATRILEQLDKLVPKEQSPKFKPGMTGKSPYMLTSDMLQGQSVRCLENGDSSQTLPGLQDPQINGSFSHTFNEATSRKHNNMEENGQALPSENITSISIKKTTPSVGIAAPPTESLFQPLNKRGFQMSAHEHTWDTDHHTDSDEAARKSKTERERKVEEFVVQGKSFPIEVLRLAKIPLSETKLPISPITQNTTSFGSFSTEKIVTSNGAAPRPPATTFHLNSDPKVVDTALPLFSFSSKHEVPSPQFSLSSPITETSNAKSSPPSDFKVTSTNSFPLYSSSPADSTFQISASDKGKNIDSKATAEEILKSVPVPTSTTTTNIFGFGNVADKLSNGDDNKDMKPYSVSAAVPSSTSSIFTVNNLVNKSDLVDKNVQSTTAEATVQPLTSVSAAIPTSFSNIFAFGNSESKPIFSNGSVASSPMAFSTSLNSSDPGSFTSQATFMNGFSQTPNGAINGITPSSLFKFGAASGAPSTSTISEAVSTDLKSKNENETTFGNNIFGSSSSSLPGTWPAATKCTTVEFGAPSTVFGNNSGMNSTSSPFCSSTQNIFSSSMGVGANTSSTASMFGSSIFNSTSTSGPTFNAFSSSSASPISSFVFGQSNSSAASPISSFVFGQSSSSATATVSSPFSSVSSFSSATATTSSSQALPTTTFGSSFPAFTASSSQALPTTTFGSSFPAFTASSSQALPTTTFGSSFPAFTTPSINNNGDQMMNMDSSMNEDVVQSLSTPPSLPVFNQQPSAASPFQFGSTGQPSFQFGQTGPSNPPPAFQASGSVEFGSGGGGSFSLGTGGDKSNRKFIRVKHKNRKK